VQWQARACAKESTANKSGRSVGNKGGKQRTHFLLLFLREHDRERRWLSGLCGRAQLDRMLDEVRHLVTRPARREGCLEPTFFVEASVAVWKQICVPPLDVGYLHVRMRARVEVLACCEREHTVCAFHTVSVKVNARGWHATNNVAGGRVDRRE
jgi:hypothetical protein